MKAIILCLLLSLALTQQHSEQKPIPFHSNLKFKNETGPGVTPEQVSFFISAANYASRVYGDDVEMNLKYIKARMDSFYGNTLTNFFVHIQTDQNVYSNSVYYMNNVYASFVGINELYPTWSYYFLLYTGTKDMSTYTYIHNGVGSGFTQDLIETVKSTVLQQQGSSCTCDLDILLSIRSALNVEISQYWSLICADLDTTHSLVRSSLNRWISIQPKNCYYTIYA